MMKLRDLILLSTTLFAGISAYSYMSSFEYKKVLNPVNNQSEQVSNLKDTSTKITRESLDEITVPDSNTSFDTIEINPDYGLHYIINKELEMIVDEGRKEIFIPNFYEFDSSSQIGLCIEQMTRKFEEIKNQKYVLRASGNEPKYFSGRNSNHFFLLAFDEDPKIDLPGKIKNIQEIREILQKYNPKVIDPSLNVEIPYLESGYLVKEIYSPNQRLGFSKDLNMREGDTLILDEGNGYLIIARLNFNKPELFELGLNKGRYDSNAQDEEYIKKHATSEAKLIIDSLINANISYGSIPITSNIFISKP